MNSNFSSEERIKAKQTEQLHNEEIAKKSTEISKLKSEKRQLEARLEKIENDFNQFKQQNLNYLSLIQQTPVGIVIIDQKGIIRFFNHYIRNLTGLQDDELVDRSIFGLLENGGKALKQWIDDENDLRQNREFTLQLRKKHNETIVMTAAVHYIEDGQQLACFMYPKQGSFTIDDQIERMDRLAMLGELATGIAHEIRNPLAGIKSSAEVIQESLNIGDFRSPLISRLIKEVDRSNELLKRFFDFAKPRKPNPEFYHIEDIIEGVILLLERRFNRKKITLNRSYGSDLPMVYVDSGQIEQILMNLLLNASEAIDREGIIKLRTELEEADNNLKVIGIKVEDNGCGITSDQLEKIFNPFYTTKSNGVGLGLSICMRLIRENGGRLMVESTKGEGSLFHLTFPIKHNIPEEVSW